ncbi:MAG: hypothetical protein IPG63_18375 [Xanthomonadales bacterium]|nr:hypothetical protein [Xanthomonadales bacterium]
MKAATTKKKVGTVKAAAKPAAKKAAAKKPAAKKAPAKKAAAKKAPAKKAALESPSQESCEESSGQEGRCEEVTSSCNALSGSDHRTTARRAMVTLAPKASGAARLPMTRPSPQTPENILAMVR